MQTLEHRPPLTEPERPRRLSGRRRSALAALVVGVVVVVAVAAIAYAVGASHTKTTTIVRTVPPVFAPVKQAAAPSSAPSCVPGAAPGSCNTDEAQELKIPDRPLDPATRALLAAQLVAARNAAMRYPTVADAQKAGMLLAGGFSPLTGAHYINISGAIGKFDPSNPGSYIYDGTSPSSRIIGLMYLAGDVLPPEGFAGPNDHWHRHSNTCIVFGQGGIVVPFPADSSVTQAQCDAKHGTFMRRTTWMVHTWVVPGWESPTGVFSHDNTDVVCANGTVKTDAAGFCQGT